MVVDVVATVVILGYRWYIFILNFLGSYILTVRIAQSRKNGGCDKQGNTSFQDLRVSFYLQRHLHLEYLENRAHLLHYGTSIEHLTHTNWHIHVRTQRTCRSLCQHKTSDPRSKAKKQTKFRVRSTTFN